VTTPPWEDSRVTVVVMSRNRRDELLTSLARHRAPVILVDNGSTDGSPDAVRAAHPHVRVVEAGRNLGAAARTLGARRARTPYVAFADDDSWWAPGSLRAGADLLDAHPGLGGVAARILIGPDERPDAVCDLLATSPLPAEGLPGPRVLGFVACATMLRREAFLAVGGFDEIVRFPGEEDRVAWDLAAAGYPIAYATDLVVHHHPSPSRHSAHDRHRAVVRSGMLTAAMRLPARRAAGFARAQWRAGGPARAGIRAAARDLPRALTRRRTLPRPVLDDLALLEGTGR